MNAILCGPASSSMVEGHSVAEVFIQSLIDLYRQGRFPFHRLIRFYAPDDINQAAEDWLAYYAEACPAHAPANSAW